MIDENIIKNAPNGANSYLIWFDNVVYFKSTRGEIEEQFINGQWSKNVSWHLMESYAYQCVSDYGYNHGDIKIITVEGAEE